MYPRHVQIASGACTAYCPFGTALFLLELSSLNVQLNTASSNVKKKRNFTSVASIDYEFLI
jgi:hypothetical protein